jgi:hypothetical protein
LELYWKTGKRKSTTEIVEDLVCAYKALNIDCRPKAIRICENGYGTALGNELVSLGIPVEMFVE